MSSVRVKCPKCGSRDTRSQGTSADPSGGTVRRRLCKACGNVFHTLEKLARAGFSWV